ncbi:MAG: cob(I)yrinic acid a,c-diamide adenosyltransferase [Pseudomonadota bacterium]
MVKLNKIYTKTGDKGTTGLGTGERVAKDANRIAAYGTVDETNSILGIVRLHLTSRDANVDQMLHRVQNDLFDLGADLCVPDRGETLDYEPLRVVEEQVVRLEGEIDQLNSELDSLKSFILPGGNPAAAYLHLARTVCRRAERMMVTLAAEDGEMVSKPALTYINRLSDFLFVVGRYVNEKGKKDILWVPGANR